MKVSSKFCTCLAIAGVIGSNVTTAIATVKACKKIDGQKLTKKEIFKKTYKTYITPTAILIATIASITGAEVINAKAQATLTASVIAAKKAYEKYSDCVKNVFGEEGETKVKTEYVKTFGTPPEKKTKEETYWLGYGFDGYFTCDPDKIEQSEYLLNKQLRTDNTATLADFLDYVGIDIPNDICIFFGWGRNELYNDMGDGWLIIDTDDIENDNGEIIHMIVFNSHPVEDFKETDKWYEVGGPFDRDVPFNLDPSQEELMNYIKEK